MNSRLLCIKKQRIVERAVAYVVQRARNHNFRQSDFPVAFQLHDFSQFRHELCRRVVWLVVHGAVAR